MTEKTTQTDMSATIGFKRVELLRHQPLGHGAYGEVYQAKCDDHLVCAAKILHQSLVGLDGPSPPAVTTRPDRTWALERFERECELLSAIRHPNIVQYLGSHRCPDTQSPLLLMELISENLTHFLENAIGSISNHTAVNICHDIALALSFLHSNDIIHRDLSSNNVLLTSDTRAKVTDFGMARLLSACQTNFTQCPGANVYMPPEAVLDQPVYTEKIDCFSFGVIIIQILTRKFPDPLDRFVSGEYDPIGAVGPRIVPEIERRDNHISLIDPTNPLRPIALDCLNDVDIDRPTARQMCERLLHLKMTRPPPEPIPIPIPVSFDPKHDERNIRLMQQIREMYKRHQEQDDTVSDLRREVHQLRLENATLQQRHYRLTDEVHRLNEASEQSRQLEARKDVEVRKEIARLQQRLNRKESELKVMTVNLENELFKQRQKYSQQIRGLQEIIHRQRQLLAESSAHVSQLNLRLTQERDQMKRRIEKQKSVEEAIIEQVEREVVRKLSIQSHSSAGSRRSTIGHGRPEVSSTFWTDFDKDLSYAGKEDEIVFHWSSEHKKVASYALGMTAHCSAVVHGNIVYFQPANTSSLFAYNADRNSWERLPDCKKRNCSLAIVKGLVTSVGGNDRSILSVTVSYSKKLYCLTGNSLRTTMKWTKILPPMPTKRSETTALCVKMALIVAGGEGRNSKALAVVEVLNTDTNQWCAATSLPQPLWGASATRCGNQLFVVGGVNVHPIRTAYECSVVSLLQSCQPPLFTDIEIPSVDGGCDVWNQITDVAVTGSSCVSMHGQVVLIGGQDSDKQRTAAVHVYDKSENTWRRIVDEMPNGRNECFAAVLSDNQLMVVGGWIDAADDETASDSIIFARIELTKKA